MKIYLDTGNLNEIQEMSQTGLIDGVTTNPTLIAKEGRDFKKEINEILKIMKVNAPTDFTISLEVTDLTNSNSMIKQAKEISKIDKHILVKIPLTIEGLKAVKELSKDKIRCNVTLCFSTSQALLAAKAGAWCVSPFVGRIEDEGWDGMGLLKDIKKVYENYNIKTKILAASVRTAEHVHEAMEIGVDIVTIPSSIFKKLYYNPLTDLGIKTFEKDWNEYQRGLKK